MDVRLHKLLLSASIFLLSSSMNQAQALKVFVAGGPQLAHLKNKPLVAITEQVSNAYLVNKANSWHGLVGFGAHYPLRLGSKPAYQFALGAAGYFFQFGQIQGLEYPFINGGLFDSLNYGLHAKSTALMVEAKAAYTPHKLQPYALLGLGSSWNKLSAFHEEASNPSLSAAPAQPFMSHQQQVFAYELGLGLQYQLKTFAQQQSQAYAAIGYHYFNLAKAELGPSAAQTTAERIRFAPLYSQGLLFSLAFSFA